MPLGILGGAALQAGAGLVQGVTDAAFAKRQARITLDKNKELADYQYSKDLDMWNKGNQYNDPKAQMARLKAAGLNPNLVYGSGSVSGNTTGTLPKYNAPTADFSKVGNPIQIPKILDLMGAFIDVERKRADVDHVKEQVNLAKQQQGMNEILNFGNKIKNARGIQEYTQSGKLFPYTLQGAVQKNKIDLADSNIRIERHEKDMRIKDAVFKNLGADYDNKVKDLAVKASSLSGQGLDQELKRIEIVIRGYAANMAAQGIKPDSPAWQQGIQKMFSDMGIKMTNMDTWNTIIRYWRMLLGTKVDQEGPQKSGFTPGNFPEPEY